MDTVKGGLSTLTQKAKDAANYGTNYKYFCIMFLIGCVFMVITLFCLPTFPISPKRPALLFNIGMICILISFGIQRGFKVFFIDQFFCGERPRNFFAIGFVITALLCLFVGVVKDSFIWTLIFFILELALCIYFLASYFPGGLEGVNYFFKFLWECIKKLCTCCRTS